MQLRELQTILKVSPTTVRRVLADVFRKEKVTEDCELTKAESTLLCLADFCESFFNLSYPVNDLLRRLWPDFQEHYGADDSAWEISYQIGLIDRRYAIWPNRSSFLDLATLEDVPELPGPPVQAHSVDVTEYYRRAEKALRKQPAQA